MQGGGFPDLTAAGLAGSLEQLRGDVRSSLADQDVPARLRGLFVRALLGVVGPVGCGKSAFIKALRSAMAGRTVDKPDVAPIVGDHMTTDIRHWSMRGVERTALVDVFGRTHVTNAGVTRDTYDQWVKLLLWGQVGIGTRHDQLPRMGQVPPRSFLNELHCVFITVQYGFHDKDRECELLKRMVKLCRDTSVANFASTPFVVIVTHADTAPDVALDMGDFYTSCNSGKLKEARVALASKIGVNPDEVVAVASPFGVRRGNAVLPDGQDGVVGQRCWATCLYALRVAQNKVVDHLADVCDNNVFRSTLPPQQVPNPPAGPRLVNPRPANGRMVTNDIHTVEYDVQYPPNVDSPCTILVVLNGIRYTTDPINCNFRVISEAARVVFTQEENRVTCTCQAAGLLNVVMH